MQIRIEQVKRLLEEKLKEPLRQALAEIGYSLSPGRGIRVSLRDVRTRRKTRKEGPATSWSPETGRIEIKFKPAVVDEGAEHLKVAKRVRSVQDPSQLSSELHPAEIDLLRALHRAESRPGWTFIALKKFRDEILPHEHFPSMRTEVEQHNVLSSVIDKRLVLLGKAANPKSPQFPVTTIRLNRLMPEVRAALGQNANADLDFHPVDISGEPLSTTVLRDRR